MNIRGVAIRAVAAYREPSRWIEQVAAFITDVGQHHALNWAVLGIGEGPLIFKYDRAGLIFGKWALQRNFQQFALTQTAAGKHLTSVIRDVGGIKVLVQFQIYIRDAGARLEADLGLGMDFVGGRLQLSVDHVVLDRYRVELGVSLDGVVISHQLGLWSVRLTVLGAGCRNAR